jgi:F0F1-type ATP synthase assembly protein I
MFVRMKNVLSKSDYFLMNQFVMILSSITEVISSENNVGGLYGLHAALLPSCCNMVCVLRRAEKAIELEEIAGRS